MSRSTNFRANFLEKISVSGAEFGESLSAEATRRVLKEQILAETSDVDLSKLRKFVVKHQIPHSYHIAVWKLILGITSCYPEGRPAVEQHRREEAKMLLRSLQIMRKATADASKGPTDSEVVAMIKLANSSVSLSALSQLKPITLQDKALGLISKQIFPLCVETGSWIDAYWLTLKFHELLENYFNENPEHLNALVVDVRAHVEHLRKLQEQRFYDNLVDSSLSDGPSRVRFFSDNSKCPSKTSANVTFSACFNHFSDDQILLWFCSGGSSLLHDEALYRLWDKLSAGESIGVILKCTLIELASQLSQLRSPSTDPKNSHASANLTENILDETVVNALLTRDVQLKAVNYAIENASRMGFFSARKE